MKAYCLIREQPVYRRDAFVSGLRAAGYEVRTASALHAALAANAHCHSDALVIWHRYGEYHELATKFERRGGTVFVAENGYLGNDRSHRTRYALALHAHNGAGHWKTLANTDRFAELGLEVKSWRTEGKHILVCPNRSFGTPGFVMPSNWAETVTERLRTYTKRPVRVRPHPGNELPKKPLRDDLRDAWAVVIWSSSAGLEALLEGIPVISESPAWVAKAATGANLRHIDNPPLPDRAPVFESVAWAQWHLTEIERGTPFLHLRD